MGVQVTLGGNVLFGSGSITLGVFMDNRGIGFYASPGLGLGTGVFPNGGAGFSISASEYTGLGMRTDIRNSTNVPGTGYFNVVVTKSEVRLYNTSGIIITIDRSGNTLKKNKK